MISSALDIAEEGAIDDVGAGRCVFICEFSHAASEIARPLETILVLL